MVHVLLRQTKVFVLLVCMAAIQFLTPYVSYSANGQDAGAVTLSTPDAIWGKAVSLLEEKGSESEAADLFQRIFDTFPNWNNAEEALWRAVQLKKRLALQATDPDWEEVLYLYRTFVTAFPKSQHAAQAYFEVGLTNQQMKLYREALTYFKIFQKRYPGSALVPQVKYRQAQVLLEIGQTDEAEKTLLSLVDSEDQALRLSVYIALGDAFFSRGKWAESLSRYQQVLKDAPHYYFDEPEILRKIGVVNCRLQDEDACRERLYYYLNLVEGERGKEEALFELAESHRRQNDDETAQRLYDLVISSGNAAGSFVDFSELRKAQYRDESMGAEAGARKSGDLNDPSEDLPFLAIIDRHHDHPLVADAMYSLFVRYRARNETALSIETGRSFLRKAQPGTDRVDDDVRDVLGYLGSNLLAAGEFEKLYELYRSEHEAVNAVQSGTFMYHVGRALEGLGLLDEAAAVYYRALAFPLNEGEKADLYFQRAQVYLAKKDFESSERLIKYLQEIYAEKPEAEMVNFLRGRFAELKSRTEESIALYEQIKSPLVYQENRRLYAEALLRTTLAQRDYSKFIKHAEIYGEQAWLPADILQGWYAEGAISAAEGNRDIQQAESLYRKAVATGMPIESAVAQKSHIGLGNIYFELKNTVESREHFQRAQKGPDAIMSKLAEERLQQLDISLSLSTMRTVLEP
jgi:tetratricopeptide (TPR) repeat protein